MYVMNLSKSPIYPKVISYNKENKIDLLFQLIDLDSKKNTYMIYL